MFAITFRYHIFIIHSLSGRKIMLRFFSSKMKQSRTSVPTITSVELQDIKFDTSTIAKILVIGETGCGECVFIHIFFS